MFNGKSILVTGGTGSFGRKFCELVLKKYKPERLIVYSRDEFKQAEMMNEGFAKHPSMRFFLGDIRDERRLTRAMQRVHYVVHGAALKQVPAAEYNPHEFINTNINGATHVVEAALNANVQKVISLSTDKAVNPINLYGATKLCSDKIFIAANSYRGKFPTEFSVVRYGNVIGSRGSVVIRFFKEKKTGVLSLTNPEMTRFYISMEECVSFVLNSFEKMTGGELFIPKLPSCTLKELAEAIAPQAEQRIVGIRPGEKMHETLIPEDEAHLTLEFSDYFVIRPSLSFWKIDLNRLNGEPCPQNFSYVSNKNPQRFAKGELKHYCEEVARELKLEDKLTLHA